LQTFLYKAIIENSTDGIVVTDVGKMDKPDGPRIIYANDTYLQMTGYSKEEVIGKTPRILQGPETDRTELDKLRTAIEKGIPGRAELINYKKNGEKFWTSISIFPVMDEQGNCTNWIGIKRDITEIKSREEQLRSALEEKETLIHEIHHRVKNNLAVMSGVIQLQALQEENEEVSNKFLTVSTRIQAMASIHEGLYKSNDFSRMEIEERLKELIYQIREILKIETEIDFDFQVDKVLMNINQAVPFSMIINEVVSNIFKHAFKGLRSGRIAVQLRKDNNRLYLMIQDNGAGLPKDFNSTGGTTLGLKVIDTLAKQLNGEYQFDRLDNGTAFRLQFDSVDIKGSADNLQI